jgi:penicillin-binding protein 2
VLQTVKDAVPGASLRLTIDTTTQREAQKALKWAMDKVGMTRGVVIAMNPQTGEILAMVSLPTYDNNQFRARDQPDRVQEAAPEQGQAAAQPRDPGALRARLDVQARTGTGGLADRDINESTKVLTRPFLTLGQTKFYEWNHRGWGPCDIYCGFGHSSDTFFYQVAGMLGSDRLAYWARQYGFGQPTGIDLPGEVGGIVPNNAWKQQTLGAPMFPGETYQAGIGQGYDAVTPLQLINAYAALANGGTLYQPQLVREIVGPDGKVVRPFSRKVLHKLKVKPAVLRVMREAARSTVTLRHTYNLVDMPIKIAGKSGTAEFGTPTRRVACPTRRSSWASPPRTRGTAPSRITTRDSSSWPSLMTRGPRATQRPR